MVVKDIQNLLENFFADGFTMDSLCKATKVSADLINKAYAKEKLDMNEYDALDIEEIESIRYKANHTIIHTPSWFSDEAGEEIQKVKEEKGIYNGSDILNTYGFTYARLYVEIEQRYENR